MGYSPWGQKESDTTEWINSNNNSYLSYLPRMTAVCLFSAQPHNVVKSPRCFYPLGCHVTTRGTLDVEVDLRVSLCQPSARQSVKISPVQEPAVNHILGGILHYSHCFLKVKWSEVAQSCPTLCDPIDCSLSGSSVHGIFQARVLEWIAISFPRGSSRPRNRIWVSRIAGRRFTVWAISGCIFFVFVKTGIPNY